MKLYRGIKTKSRLKHFLLSLMTVGTVFADEQRVDEPSSGTDEESNKKHSPINFEDLIAKARKEEKDKLYPKIKTLEGHVSSLTTANNNHIVTIAEKDAEISRLNEKLKTAAQDEPDIVKTLKLQTASLEKQLDELKNSQPPVIDEEALRASIREEMETEYTVKLYRLEKLKDLGDEILTPELVTGTTTEEIDQSIETQKAKTLEIKKKLGVVDEDGKPIHQPKKPKPTPNNPPKDKGQRVVDFEYLSTLDPASPEYREARAKLGIR